MLVVHPGGRLVHMVSRKGINQRKQETRTLLH